MRLDTWLTQKYPGTSRTIFQKLIAQGRVRVDDQPVSTASFNVGENTDIKVDFPEAPNFASEIKSFAKNVVYEDENVVVINKPAGILTHSKGEMNDEFTVADFVKSRIIADGAKQPSDDAFINTNRPGIVHRLDRATSGILIAAKNPETAKMLQRQFSDRKTKKTYLALVAKMPKAPEARIDLPIGRNPKKPAQFRVDAKGKSAVTDYKTIKTFADGSALVELKPTTGRTHQLRVHMAHIGAPIVGDVVYGRPAKRMFLHAAQLEITIPHGQRIIFTAPVPADFQEEIDARSVD